MPGNGSFRRASGSLSLVEAALAHTVRNPTAAAYARSDLFERRRHLMDDRAAYLDSEHGHVPVSLDAGMVLQSFRGQDRH